MTIAPDDAREALTNIGGVEERVLDIATRYAIGPGLATSGWIGLVGFGLQSRLVEVWFGAKFLTGYLGVAIILACLVVPVLAFRPFLRPMLIKGKSGYHAQVIFGGFIGMAIMMLIMFPNAMPGPAAQAAWTAFGVGLGLVVAQMLWLGRWLAFGAFAIMLVIGLIHVHEPNPEIKFTFLAAFCVVFLMPVGIWMIVEDHKHVI